jgi:hypothetical protein
MPNLTFTDALPPSGLLGSHLVTGALLVTALPVPKLRD